MKKILLSAVILLGTLTVSAQQDVNAIINRFMKETGLVEIAGQEYSMFTDAVINAQGQEMPFKSISQNPGQKMRIEMEQAGQKVFIIVNGTKGWVNVPGVMTQAIPDEQVSQSSGQFDILDGIILDKNKIDFEFVGEEGDMLLVKMVSKKDPDSPSIGKFNKNTGLLETVETTKEGQVIITTLSDYKQFDGLRIPSIFSVKVGEKEVMKVIIKNLELDYPTAEYMFTEPK